MRPRLRPLYLYVKELYTEFPDEFHSLSTPERRMNFVLGIVENDLGSLPLHKKALYDWDTVLSTVGLSHAFTPMSV